MSLDELQHSLNGLKALSEELPDDQAEIKERAGRLIEELESQVLGLREETDPSHEERRGSLLENLRHFAEQFEAEHPRLTEASNRVSVMLSGMGI